jgi:hypothetical protein
MSAWESGMSDRIGLRTRIEDAIIVHTERCDCCPLVDKPEKLADAVLRVLNDYVTEVRAEERQRIADKLAAVPDEVYPVDVFGGPLSTDESREANELLKDAGLPTFDRVGANAMRHAYRVAARLAREEED